MINKLKRWIGNVAERQMRDNHPVPTIVTHGNMPLIQVYKISNGYLVSKTNSTPYRDDSPSVIFCATPIDVARQIVNTEALEKLGIQNVPDHLKTTGRASGAFAQGTGGASGDPTPNV